MGEHNSQTTSASLTSHPLREIFKNSSKTQALELKFVTLLDIKKPQ